MITSEKSILKYKLFEVRELKITVSEGKNKVHRIVNRYPTVSVFPLTEKNEIYLVSQYRYLLKKITLEAMSGFIEEGETTVQAAKRELEEETGLSAMQLEELMRVELSASVIKAVSHIFLAKGLEQGSQKQDEEEKITVIKMPLKEAVKKVLSGEINHASSMIGILLLDKLKQERKI